MVYAGRRVVGTVGVLLIVSVAVFALLHVAPGDPARVVAGAEASPEQVAQVRDDLGLDRPLVSQYCSWLGGALRGDLGESYGSGREVAELIVERIPSTASLLALALLLMVALSFPVGFGLTSTRRAVREPIDLATSVAMSVPPFVSGIILIFLFSVVWRVMPSGGEVSFFSDPASSLRFLVLPALALALPQSAVLARLLATEIRRARQQEYVQTAIAKGASPSRVALVHVLPDSLGPWIIQLGVNVGVLVGGALVVEAIFARAGIGGLLIDAVASRDYPVAQGVLLLTVTAAIAAQLVADLVNARRDRRIVDAVVAS